MTLLCTYIDLLSLQTHTQRLVSGADTRPSVMNIHHTHVHTIFFTFLKLAGEMTEKQTRKTSVPG